MGVGREGWVWKERQAMQNTAWDEAGADMT